MNNITKQLKFQQDTRRLLKAFYKISALLHNQQGIQQMVDVFLKEVVQLTQATSGAICLHNITNYEMELISQYRLEEKVKEVLSCELIESSYVEFFEFHHHEILNQKISQLLSRDDLINHEFPQYFHLLPILNTSQNLGVLILFSEKKEFTIEAEEFLMALLEQLGIALVNESVLESTQDQANLEARSQLAKHLHDTIAQNLSSIQLQIQRVDRLLQDHQYKEAQESIPLIQEALSESIDTVRQVLVDFRIPLKLVSFSHQLAELIKRFQVMTKIEIQTSVRVNELQLNQDDRLEVVFILQEALANVHKHAKASVVELQIYSTENKNYIVLKDNGQGFEESLLLQHSSHHMGIDIMRERARSLGARLSIRSQIGKGTKVILSIPKQKESA